MEDAMREKIPTPPPAPAEKALVEALAQTFPASDPPAMIAPGGGDEAPEARPLPPKAGRPSRGR